jgi:hypothetical protein
MRRQVFVLLAILLALGAQPARMAKLLSLDPRQKAKVEVLGR